jgi:hypothetical protein
VGIDDFNGDHKPDIIWQHTDGWLSIWFMKGINAVSGQALSPNNPGDPGSRVNDAKAASGGRASP